MPEPDPPPSLELLDELVRRLRAPDGCPWDREQGPLEIRAYLLEEAHEVADALDSGDWDHLAEEMGDLLFQLAFLGRLAQEAGRPGLGESARRVHEKMVERHPHVFGDAPETTSHEVARAWERRKLDARDPGASLLDGVGRSLPALLTSYRMTQKAAGVGFDWSSPEAVVAKVREELAEVEAEIGGERERLRDEVGDLLFAVANLARHLDLDPEAALAGSNLKFRRRFAHIETELAATGRRLTEATAEELENLWEAAKKLERERADDAQSGSTSGSR